MPRKKKKSSCPSEKHVSVLKQEFLDLFADQEIRVFFDGTLGAGGHAEALLENHPEIETYIGCDQDEEALEIAMERLKPFGKKVVFMKSNFSEVDEVLDELKIDLVDGFFLT